MTPLTLVNKNSKFAEKRFREPAGLFSLRAAVTRSCSVVVSPPFVFWLVVSLFRNVSHLLKIDVY